MKAVIVYTSRHHGNTKMLVDAIAGKYNVDIINAASCETVELADYDLIGIASGVAYAKYYPQMLSFLERNLPNGKKVFFLHTAGSPRKSHNAAAKEITDARKCICLGTYFCKGYDTYGPFKVLGGIAKGHPNQDEIAAVIRFFGELYQSGTDSSRSQDEGA